MLFFLPFGKFHLRSLEFFSFLGKIVVERCQIQYCRLKELIMLDIFFFVIGYDRAEFFVDKIFITFPSLASLNSLLNPFLELEFLCIS